MHINAFIAVNRFGLGASPGDLAAVGDDPRAWLSQQLTGPAPVYPQFAQLHHSGEALKAYPRWIASLGQDRPAMAAPDGLAASAAMAASAAVAPRTVESTFREQLGPQMLTELGARLAVAASTPAPFHERLAWFWANHFSVSAEKALVFALVGSFEREAIRPHVNGHFVDMLLASTRHPAMLLYLDNHLSVRQDWQDKGLRRRASAAFPSPTGLNENLAREILELHTLGVNGGYAQRDVTEFARVITGWTARPTMFDLRAADPGFHFEPDRHEAGPRTLMGQRYAQEGMAQGEAVLRDLAAHPATARHIATKLARHFIADDPPPDAIARLDQAFRDSGGHLPTVHAALLACPQAWDARLSKLKTPIEYLVSCLRTLPAGRGAAPAQRDAASYPTLYATLRGMGQRPFFAPSPQGWPDTAQAWASGDALWKRIEWAGIVAARAGSSVDPLRLASASYGAALGGATRQAIARAESPQQGLALWLASPEFQRR